MKLHLFAAALMLFVLSCKTIEPNRNERKVDRKNTKKAGKGVLDKEVADFLVGATHYRLLAIKEAKLAAKKGSTLAVREFGRDMEDLNEAWLKEIKKMAKERKVTLPTKLSAETEVGYDKLDEKSGKTFDKKYLKAFKSATKQEIKSYKIVSELDDPGLIAFTDIKKPLLEANLEKIKSVKKSK